MPSVLQAARRIPITRLDVEALCGRRRDERTCAREKSGSAATAASSTFAAADAAVATPAPAGEASQRIESQSIEAGTL